MENFPIIQAGDGVIRQVLCENEDMMMVSFRFEKDAIGALHHHPHVQASYIQSGKFKYTIDGKDFVVERGQSVVIPSNVEHGCVCLEAGELLDSFTPRRDDFL